MTELCSHGPRARSTADAGRVPRAGGLLLALLLASLGCEPAADAPPAPAARPRPAAATPRPTPPERAEATVEPALAPFEALDRPIEAQARAAAIDLDADGRDEIVLASFQELAVLGATGEKLWSAESPGGATAIATGDLDGDGRDDVVVGWGMHVGRRDAPALLRVYRTRGAAPGTLREETVASPQTPRAQFGSIQVAALEPGGRPGILFSHFRSTYELRGVFAQLEGEDRWREQELYRMRMGSLLVSAPGPSATRRLLVGRSYGDKTRSPGDVFVLAPDGHRTGLPSLRGVRSLAAVALGPAEAPLRAICYGDGWHWRYGEQARGRLTCVRDRPGGGFDAQLVAVTDSYSLETLAPADLDGDGQRELIGQGAQGIYRFTPVGSSADAGPAWRAAKIGSGGGHFAVADTDGDGRDELVVIGSRAGLIRLP